MKKFKGTKAPWDYTVNESRCESYVSIHSKGYNPDENDYQGENRDKTSICGIWGNINDEDIANARLISAAPDMLEALQSIAEYWDTPQSGSLHQHVLHPLELAQKAINKALGKK